VTDLSPYGGGKQVPDKIVVHCMAEFIKEGDGYTHAADFLHKIRLSAHILIAPDGEIFRLRHDDEIAYHAKGFNANSLGVEFLVSGRHDYASFIEAIRVPYLFDRQYLAGVAIVKEWVKKYQINDIYQHSELSPERKLDPSTGFPWSKFIKEVKDV